MLVSVSCNATATAAAVRSNNNKVSSVTFSNPSSTSPPPPKMMKPTLRIRLPEELLEANRSSSSTTTTPSMFWMSSGSSGSNSGSNGGHCNYAPPIASGQAGKTRSANTMLTASPPQYTGRKQPFQNGRIMWVHLQASICTEWEQSSMVLTPGSQIGARVMAAAAAAARGIATTATTSSSSSSSGVSSILQALAGTDAQQHQKKPKTIHRCILQRVSKGKGNQLSLKCHVCESSYPSYPKYYDHLIDSTCNKTTRGLVSQDQQQHSPPYAAPQQQQQQQLPVVARRGRPPGSTNLPKQYRRIKPTQQQRPNPTYYQQPTERSSYLEEEHRRHLEEEEEVRIERAFFHTPAVAATTVTTTTIAEVQQQQHQRQQQPERKRVSTELPEFSPKIIKTVGGVMSSPGSELNSNDDDGDELSPLNLSTSRRQQPEEPYTESLSSSSRETPPGAAAAEAPTPPFLPPKKRKSTELEEYESQQHSSSSSPETARQTVENVKCSHAAETSVLISMIEHAGDQAKLANLKVQLTSLLVSLLGEKRLSEMGYPDSDILRLLAEVLLAAKGQVSSAAQEEEDCSAASCPLLLKLPSAATTQMRYRMTKREMEAARTNVRRLLEICVPDEQVWDKYDWRRKNVEDILYDIQERGIGSFGDAREEED